VAPSIAGAANAPRRPRPECPRGFAATLPPFFPAHLLMPDFGNFARLHPGIEMKTLSSIEKENQTNRKADVAIDSLAEPILAARAN